MSDVPRPHKPRPWCKIAALLLVGVCALGAGCAKPAESEVRVNGNFQVSRLFSIDGCQAYRFFDADRYRYFVRCGETVSAGYEQLVYCGKTCYRHDPEEITTTRGEALP